MSTTTTTSAAATVSVTMPPPDPSGYFTNLGLGYSIAIALGFLVLLSTILLASYVCCRASRHRSSGTDHSNNDDNHGNLNSSREGIILPRILFVAEDDEELEREQETAAIGLDKAVINSYPKFQFTKDGNDKNKDSICSICLCEYKDLEMLRMMPECRHFFHSSCLDAWLELNGSCPVCRNSPLPTPLSTPLSEVVPLSQYAADRRRRR